MSRAIGIGSTQFIGVRVAGQVTYIPAHTKAGKNINQRCTIPVYLNSNKGTNRDGTQGRSDRFRLVAWGKLADICARSLPKGKALDCICAPHSYEGRIYDAQGNMRVDQTGQPITVERVGFTIEKIVFGEESQKEIDLEIAEGRRPVNWNITSHPDSQMWANILQTRRQTAPQANSNTFGFARVIVPTGPEIALMTQAPVQAPFTATMGTSTDPTQLATLIQQVLSAQAQNNVVPNTVPGTGVIPPVTNVVPNTVPAF